VQVQLLATSKKLILKRKKKSSGVLCSPWETFRSLRCQNQPYSTISEMETKTLYDVLKGGHFKVSHLM